MSLGTSQPSTAAGTNVTSFERPDASPRAVAALDLVYQAANTLRAMEDRAQDAESRARLMGRETAGKLQAAEARAEAAERANRDMIAEVDRKLNDAARALEQAHARIQSTEENAAAAERRAQAAEARANKAEETLALVEEAIRKRLLTSRPLAEFGLSAAA